MLKLGEFLQLDSNKIWLEFIGYRSFVMSLPEPRSLIPLAILKLGEFLQLDDHKIWLEFIGNRLFVESLPEPHSLMTVYINHRTENLTNRHSL